MAVLFPALVIALLLLIACCSVSLVYMLVKARNVCREIVSPAQEGELSPLGKLLDQTASMFSDKIAMVIKTSLLGKISAVSKSLSGMEQDIAQDQVASANPLLGALMALSPKLTKRVFNSPLAGILLNQAVKKFGPQNGAAQPTTNPEDNALEVY